MSIDTPALAEVARSGDRAPTGARATTTPLVLTDVPGKPGGFWNTHTTFVGPSRAPRWLEKMLGSRLANNLCGTLAAIRLFLRRRRCQGVVTCGGASGLLFAWLQALVPWGRKPHVMVDCNWYESPLRWKTWLKALRLRLAARSVTRCMNSVATV